VLIFKGLTVWHLYKSFGVKQLNGCCIRTRSNCHLTKHSLCAGSTFYRKMQHCWQPLPSITIQQRYCLPYSQQPIDKHFLQLGRVITWIQPVRNFVQRSQSFIIIILRWPLDMRGTHHNLSLYLRLKTSGDCPVLLVTSTSMSSTDVLRCSSLARRAISLICISACLAFLSVTYHHHNHHKPVAQTCPVLDSSSFVPILTLPHRTSLNSTSRVLAVRISCCVIALFVFIKPLFIN
jgi:hypothetical protein